MDGGGDGAPRLAMPAAELFGAWAVAEAVAAARGGAPTTVTAVSDCEPAVGALNAAASGNAQMRELLRGARRLGRYWLAVHVAREWNQDADRLSHPAQLETVLADARAAGLSCSVARVPAACWDALGRAAALGGAVPRRSRKRKPERGRDQRPA